MIYIYICILSVNFKSKLYNTLQSTKKRYFRNIISENKLNGF